MAKEYNLKSENGQVEYRMKLDKGAGYVKGYMPLASAKKYTATGRNPKVTKEVDGFPLSVFVANKYFFFPLAEETTTTEE